MNHEEYTPQHLSGDLWTVAIRVEKCPMCDRNMICRYWQSAFPFPSFYRDFAERQYERAGFVKRTMLRNKDHKLICERCADEGKADFECYLCKKIYTRDNLQESHGDPADHLCKTCYRTVPAEQWDKTVEELEEAHRWDYE